MTPGLLDTRLPKTRSLNEEIDLGLAFEQKIVQFDV